MLFELDSDTIYQEVYYILESILYTNKDRGIKKGKCSKNPLIENRVEAAGQYP